MTATESLRLVIDEAMGLVATLALAENLAVASAEAIDLRAILAAAESMATGVTETGSTVVVAAVSDAVALGSSEAAPALTVLITAAEAHALGMTEAQALLAATSATELLLVVPAEAVTLLAALAAADTAGLTIDDRGLLVVRLDVAAEAIGLSVSELADISEIVLIELAAAATVVIQLGEGAGVEITTFPDAAGRLSSMNWTNRYLIHPQRYTIKRRFP